MEKFFINRMTKRISAHFLLRECPTLIVIYLKYDIHLDNINNIYSVFVNERLKIARSTLHFSDFFPKEYYGKMGRCNNTIHP